MSEYFQHTTKYSKPATCIGCPLEIVGYGFTIPKIAPVGAPLIVTDSVGPHEVRVGTPLQVESDSGSMLERAFRLAGLSPNSFAFGSLVACKTPQPLPNQTYEFTAPQFCSTAHLLPYIEQYRPRCIVALGPIAARALTGLSGDKLTLDMIRGYVVPGVGVAHGIPVIAAPSPSYIMAGMHHEMSLLVRDLQKAARTDCVPDDSEVEQYILHAPATGLEARSQGRPAYHSLEFLLDQLLGNPELILVFDFEFASISGEKKKKGSFSTDAHITQANFTLIDMSNANPIALTMVADWNPSTKPIIIKIVQTINRKVSFNGYHTEEPVAVFNGFEVMGSEHHDAMWMVHFLFPDLPARRIVDDEEYLTGDDGALMPLQVAASLFDFAAPWKHLNGMDPHFYGARDTHANAVVFLGCVQLMIERHSWGTYEYFIRRFRTTLKAGEDIGYPMSRRKLGDIQDFVKAELFEQNARIQDIVPPDLKPYRERKPRTDSELEKMMEQHGTNVFKKEVDTTEQCDCGKESVGQPATGCEDCSGTGMVEGRRVKCQTCAKHSLIKPETATDRWACQWCKWIDSSTTEELGEYIAINGKPRNLRSFYKTRHDDDLRSGRYLCPACKGDGLQATSKPCQCTKRMTYDPLCSRCHGNGSYRAIVPRYCIRQAFNANSSDQLKRYAQARGHQIPASGMGRAGLAQLSRSTGDPVYNVAHSMKILEAIGASLLPITNIASMRLDDAPDTERIHTNFMFTDAAGMISSKNPDIITPPPAHKYPALSLLWSSCLIYRPTPTTKLVHVDFGPLELECFALDAQDESLLSIIHPTGNASDNPAEEWLLKTANFKASLQGTGAIAAIYRAFMRADTPQTVFTRHRHLFSGPDTVAYLLAKLDYHFPRSVEYRRMMSNQAHKQGFLRSRFGYERQFYGVTRRNREGGNPDPGADYHNAVSFMARNHAACVLAIAAMTGWTPDQHFIAPTEGPYGPNGFLVEIPVDDKIGAVTVAPGIITRPDGKPYVFISQIREPKETNE